MTEGKTARASYTEMTELVLPQHGNVLGSAFGGTVLAWIDVCGAIAFLEARRTEGFLAEHRAAALRIVLDAERQLQQFQVPRP